MNQKLLALYGLKWNPFTPEVPTEALYVPPKVENFCWRIEQAHLREGGFALIHGYEKEPVMESCGNFYGKNADCRHRSFPLFSGMSHLVFWAVPTRRCTCRFWNSLPITMFG